MGARLLRYHLESVAEKVHALPEPRNQIALTVQRNLKADKLVWVVEPISLKS